MIKGLNDFPLISISAIQSTEARRRDAERHTLICAYNKYRYHSKMLVRVAFSSHTTRRATRSKRRVRCCCRFVSPRC